MAAYLGYEFVDAAEVVRFEKDGTFNAEVTNEILSARLAELEHAVIPDFTVQQKMEQSLHFQEAALMSPVLS